MDKSGPTYSFESHPRYSVVALSPSMNDSAWSEIEKTGDDVLKELDGLSTRHLIVDLSELEYIGSAMVALVVRIWKAVKAKGGRMAVVNRNALVLEVFKIAKLDQVWTIVEFREDAVEELGLNEPERKEGADSVLLAVVGVLAALVASAVLGLYFAKPEGFTSALSMLGYGCAIVGIVAGAVLWISGTGGRRAAGIFAVLLSVIVSAASAYYIPRTGNGAVPPEDNPPQTARDSTKNSAGPQTTPRPDAPAVAEKPPGRSK